MEDLPDTVGPSIDAPNMALRIPLPRLIFSDKEHFILLKSFKHTPGLCIAKMHTANIQILKLRKSKITYHNKQL
jgi:hypothetical protein